MTRTVGGNLNTNNDAVVSTIEINSVTATKIGDIVGVTGRVFFQVALEPGMFDINVFIRLYPAGDDNIKQGIPLVRQTFGNSNLFNAIWEMPPGQIYLGEISAISESGTINLMVTEF